MRASISLIVLFLLMSGCRSSRFTVNTPPDIRHSSSEVQNYISEYSQMAMNEMIRTGVPASITLSQGMIESDYGRSRLATAANNHFGIKCHSSWKGKKIYHDDDRRKECFRKYSNAEDSFTDHSDFLKDGSRYSFLFDLRADDYKAWAKGLKKAGYATNPRYANMLISKIDEEKLYLYDQYVIAGNQGRGKDVGVDKPVTQETDIREISNQVEDIDNFVISSKSSRILVRNRIEYIIIKEGDSYKSLNDEYDLLSWEIFKYNDLDDDDTLYTGQLIYLQPKRNKAEAGNEFHIVKDGETMYSISQLYGIRLRSLYEKNRMMLGDEPLSGKELWLRKLKPEGF